MIRMALIVTFLSLASGNAYACSCAYPEPVEERIEKSDLFAKVVLVSEVSVEHELFVGDTLSKVRIVEAYKGDIAVGDIITFKHYNGNEPAACGVSFEEGEDVLVLTQKYKDHYRISSCDLMFGQYEALEGKIKMDKPEK